MDFTTPVLERSGTPAQRGGPSTLQARMAYVDASSPLVETDARKAKQAERLASHARLRGSIRRDLSAGKDSSVPSVGSLQEFEQPAAKEGVEEAIPTSSPKFGASKLFKAHGKPSVSAAKHGQLISYPIGVDAVISQPLKIVVDTAQIRSSLT